MADRIGGIQVNISGYTGQAGIDKPEKTGGQANAEPLDLFANADINPDTMSKIPQFLHKNFTPGNRVDVLTDGRITPEDKSDDIFEQVEKAIRGAKETVQIEMFELSKQGLVDLLCEEVKRGVRIQVITHPSNEKSSPEKQMAMDKLVENGVQLLTYPVEPPGELARYGQLDHVKLLVVDGNSAIIGGMNWGEHSPSNHDFDVRVEGPEVDDMEWLFRKDWLKSGGNSKDLPWISDTSPQEGGSALVNVVTSGLDADDKTIGKTVVRAIDNARKSIHVEMFTMTHRETVDALINAHGRGLDVRVILSPLKIGDYAVNEKAAKRLKDAGVPVKWYSCNPETKEKLHAKTAIIDDDQAIVGSANWSFAGFNVNREANVEVLSRSVNSKLSGIFDGDWESKTTEDPVYLEDADNNAGG